MMRKLFTGLILATLLWSGIAQAAPRSPWAVAVKDVTCQPYEGPKATFHVGDIVVIVDQVAWYKTCGSAGQEYDCSHMELDGLGDIVMYLSPHEEVHLTPAEKAGIQCMADALTGPK